MVQDINIKEALTFDDVLLEPAYSDLLPSEVEISTQLTRNIPLNIPLLSAAMDTVTDSRMAIAIAQQGGIGIIHKNMTIEKQAEEIDRVKRSESGMIVNPITMSPDQKIHEAVEVMQQYKISGLPITANGKLVGILTNRDLRFQERMIMLQVLDMQWKDHLWSLDHLKEGIGLRGYAQKDPLIEYKKESFDMFESLRTRIEEETIRFLYLFEPISREEQDAREKEREEARRKLQREQNLVYSAGDSAPVAPAKRETAKVGRNDLCPCGSGKKYKKCHGS